MTRAKATRSALLLVFCGYTLLITWLSLANINAEESFGHADKVNHFAAYGVFAMIAGLTFTKQPGLVWAVLFVAGYGGAMELIQGLSPHRDASWLDMLANLLGVIFGSAAIAWAKNNITALHSLTREEN